MQLDHFHDVTSVRQREIRPLLGELRDYIQANKRRFSAKSNMTKAFNYILGRWDGLNLFVDDGRVELDSNVVERAIKPQVLTRKNALFAGSAEGASYYPSNHLLIKAQVIVGLCRNASPRLASPRLARRASASRTTFHIVILDNLGSHKDETVRKAIRAAGARLLFLPPYSPDLNPIEQFFAKLKTLLRKAAERSVEATWRRIGSLLDALSAHECANYLKNSGYASI